MKILTPTPPGQHLSILLNFEVKLPTCSSVIITVQICQYPSCFWAAPGLMLTTIAMLSLSSKLWNLNEVKMLTFRL